VRSCRPPKSCLREVVAAPTSPSLVGWPGCGCCTLLGLRLQSASPSKDRAGWKTRAMRVAPLQVYATKTFVGARLVLLGPIVGC
jgi:hypothetical protein